MNRMKYSTLNDREGFAMVTYLKNLCSYDVERTFCSINHEYVDDIERVNLSEENRAYKLLISHSSGILGVCTLIRHLVGSVYSSGILGRGLGWKICYKKTIWQV